MTGFIVVALAVLFVLAIGVYRRQVDGKVRTVNRPEGSVAQGPFTVLQFSSEFCAPCRRARTLLSELTQSSDLVRHVEVDVAEEPGLTSRHKVNRTPTVLVLDANDVVRHRVVGELRPQEFERALTELGAVASVNR